MTYRQLIYRFLKANNLTQSEIIHFFASLKRYKYYCLLPTTICFPKLGYANELWIELCAKFVYDYLMKNAELNEEEIILQMRQKDSLTKIVDESKTLEENIFYTFKANYADITCALLSKIVFQTDVPFSWKLFTV